MTDKLKPCPWCKDKPETQRTVHRLIDGLTLEYWWVQCDNAKCPVMPESLSYNTEAEAIAAWNTCANDNLTAESVVSDKRVDANDGNAAQADSRERLEEAMRNVIRDALLNLKTAIMCCVEQGMDVLSFDEGEFVDYEPQEYVDEYLSRAMRLLDRQEAITERHWMEICGANANANVELKRHIDSLTAERDELRKERDHWHVEQVHAYGNWEDVHEYAKKLEAERDELREELEDEKLENGWARDFLNRMGPKCGTADCPSLVAYVNNLEAERNELQSIIDHMPKTEAECEACQEAHDRLMFNCKVDMDKLRDELTEKQHICDMLHCANDSLRKKLHEKQHVCDVQRDSFLKLEAENAELRRMLADAAEAI